MASTFRFILAGIAACGVATSAGWAAHHEDGGDGAKHRQKKHGHRFEKRDADGSGEISQQEWLAASEARFAEMDADGNGSLSQAEWDAAHQRMKERWKKKREEQGS